MARNPFSQQFIVYTDPAPNVSYEVPPNMVAVVRDITAFSLAAIGGLTASLQNSGEAPPCVFAALVGADVPWYQQWQGRVVVPAGGFISIAWSGVTDGLSAYVGGYLLLADLP